MSIQREHAERRTLQPLAAVQPLAVPTSQAIGFEAGLTCIDEIALRFKAMHPETENAECFRLAKQWITDRNQCLPDLLAE